MPKAHPIFLLQPLLCQRRLQDIKTTSTSLTAAHPPLIILITPIYINIPDYLAYHDFDSIALGIITITY